MTRPAAPTIPGHTGYGLMGFTTRTNQAPDSEIFPVLLTALRLGATFWNSSVFYGTPTNPIANIELLARFFAAYPEAIPQVTLSIKGAMNVATMSAACDRAGITKSINDAYDLLNPVGKKIDIFECARVDPNVPIEESIKVIAEFVAEGKVGGIGLSETKAETIRRAHAVHPIAGVEVEVSLWSREIFKNGVADTCAELGIPVIAYSPLGRGFLARRFEKIEDIPQGDFRRIFDRFQAEAFEKNEVIVKEVEKVAEELGVGRAQVALGWVRWRARQVDGLKLVPLPGATTEERLSENMEVKDVGDEAYERLDKFMDRTEVVGGRYNDHHEKELMQ